ncbi:L domain-like protein, partial [Rhizoclosmatium globosum]
MDQLRELWQSLPPASLPTLPHLAMHPLPAPSSTSPLQTRLPAEIVQTIFSLLPPNQAQRHRRLCRWINICLSDRHFVAVNLEAFFGYDHSLDTTSTRIDQSPDTLAADPRAEYNIACLKWPGNYQAEYAHLFLSNVASVDLKGLFGTTPKGPLETITLGFQSLTGLMIPGIVPNAGTIPSIIGSLEHLTQLKLEDCNFVGSIPVDLFALKQLTLLNLNNNRLSGPVPSEIGKLTTLTELRLHQNSFNGPIPESISQLKHLEILNLSQNQFSGHIHWIGSFPHLSLLFIDRNQFSGFIPESIGNLRNLEVLIANINLLTGPIPLALYRLTSLRSLYLGDNRLTGQIHPDIGHLRQLVKLTLERNWLSGSLPDEIAELENLAKLNLFPNPGMDYIIPRRVRENARDANSLSIEISGVSL